MMRIHILFALFAISIVIVTSKTFQIYDNDVKQRWTWLSQQLNQIVQFAMPENDLSEESYIKIFSHEMPKLTSLSFNNAAFEDYEFYESLPVSLTPKIYQTIFTSKYFPQLKLLDLTQTNANDQWFQFLENTEINSSLQVLKIKGLRIGKKGYNLLSKINFNGKLKYLQLDGTLLLENETISSLLKIICKYDENNKCTTQLETLLIENTEITRDGFIRLMDNLNTTTLKSLYLNSAFLHYNKAYKEGFNYSAFKKLASLSFPNLQELQFNTCGINDEIAKIFSNWKLPSLKKLMLMSNPISDEGIKQMVLKQNMPKLSIFSVFSTDVVDQTFKHLKEQNFSLTSLNFGQTKITYKGLKYLKQTNLQSLQKLTIAGLHIKPQLFYSFLKQINCKNLEQLNLGGMNDMGDFLKQFPWRRFKQLKTLRIAMTDIGDGFVEFSKRKSEVLPNLQKLQLTQVKITFQGLNAFIDAAPTLFPKLNRLAILQKNYLPVSLRKVYALAYPEGSLFNFNYVKFKKSKKIQIIKLFIFQFLLYDNTEDSQMSSISLIFEYLGLLMERIDYQTLKVCTFVNEAQLQFFKMLFQLQPSKKLPKLTKVLFAPEFNVEDFFRLFDAQVFPNIKEAVFSLTVPGDIQESFIEKKLYPFFTRFEKLQILRLSLTFLNEETGPEMKKKFLSKLNYPFLRKISLQQQELTAQDLREFIQRHSKTLTQLDVKGNFLQKDFFQLLAQNKVALESLNLQGISYTAPQFAKFGKVQTSFLKGVSFAQADLSNEHIKLMIEAKSPGPYFPKLSVIIFMQNNIQRQGLQTLFQTQMFNLEVIINERNSNPNFLNTLLKYPTKVKAIIAESFDVYSLDKDLKSISVSQVILLDVKAYSFTAQDFQILGILNFNRLQNSFLYLSNIYDCQVLKDLLKINREATGIGHKIQNDKIGFNSKCLAGMHHESKLIKIQIQDQFGTTYIPQYIQLLTNSTRNIDYVSLSRTLLSPDSLKRILSKRLHSAYYINLPYNYIDDETLKVALSGQLDHLRYLNLKSTLITSQSVVNIAAKQAPLAYLDLSLNQLDARAIEAIRPLANTLQYLQLNGCNLQGDSLKILNGITFLALLELNLNYNKFTEEDIFQFLTDLQRKNAPSLKAIKLKGVSLSIPKFQILEKITLNKGFQNIELDRPYNIPQSNAAKY